MSDALKGKTQREPQKGSARCEACEFYDYDEYSDTYCCEVSLDEDELTDLWIT